jgi:hypothetical protein
MRNLGLTRVFAIYPETITLLLKLYFQVPTGSDRSTIGSSVNCSTLALQSKTLIKLFGFFVTRFKMGKWGVISYPTLKS